MANKVDEEEWENLTLEQKLNVLRSKINEMTSIIQKIVEDMYVDEEDCEGEEEIAINGEVKTQGSREFQEFRYIT
jgi:SMC interacting uncharacterized protein involved in chromosome segregation